jgi:hypothetical protein
MREIARVRRVILMRDESRLELPVSIVCLEWREVSPFFSGVENKIASTASIRVLTLTIKGSCSWASFLSSRLFFLEQKIKIKRRLLTCVGRPPLCLHS